MSMAGNEHTHNVSVADIVSYMTTALVFEAEWSHLMQVGNNQPNEDYSFQFKFEQII